MGYEVAGWANSSLLQYSGVELRAEDTEDTRIHLTEEGEKVPDLYHP